MNMTSLKWADLVEAMGRMHRHRCHILDLVSPTPGRTLFGQAGDDLLFPELLRGPRPQALHPRESLLRGGRRRAGCWLPAARPHPDAIRPTTENRGVPGSSPGLAIG